MGIFNLVLGLILLGCWSYLFIDAWITTGSIPEALKDTGIGYTILTIIIVFFDIMSFTFSFQDINYNIHSISTHEDNNGVYILGCGGQTTDTEYKIYVKDKKSLKCKYVDADDCTLYSTKGKEHYKQNSYSTKMYLHQDTIDRLTK